MLFIDMILAFAVILLVGFIAVGMANKLKVPHALFLIVAGMLLQKVTFDGVHLVSLPMDTVIGFVVIALCMITFDAAARMPKMTRAQANRHAVYSTVYTCGLFIVVLTPIIQLLFFRHKSYNIGLWFASLLVAILMSESSLDTVSVTYQKIKNRAIQLLEKESVINTPIFLLLTFVIMSAVSAFMKGHDVVVNNVTTKIFLTNIVLSFCCALLVGVVLFRYMRRLYSKVYSPVALFAGVLITYALAVMVKANGFLAVLFVGFMFGSFTLENKHKLEEFSTIFSALIEIVVYILLGLFAAVTFTIEFVFVSAIIYCVMLFLRFIAIQFAFPVAYSFEEKLFFTVNTPKGISVAIIALFLLSVPTLPGMREMISLVIMLMFYSHLGHAFTMGKQIRVTDLDE